MQFLVGTLIAFAALAVAYVTYIQQKKGGGLKRLHYTVFWDLLSLNRGGDRIDELIEGPISVNLEPSGRRLVLPLAFKLKLSNTGKAPILPTDFASPLTINFGEHCNFVGGTIDCRPHAVEDIFKSDGFKVEQGCLKIQPFLLNVGDEITFTGILNGIIDEEGITLAGRVAGVNTFTRLESKEGGIDLKLLATSMLHKSMTDWPKNPALDAKVIVMPKFLPLDDMTPGESHPAGITTRFNGVPIKDMHVVNFMFNNTSVGHLDFDATVLVFESTSSTFHSAEMLINGQQGSELDASRLLEWSAHRVAIRIGRLAPDDTLLVKVISEGGVQDLTIVDRPQNIEEVQIWRTEVVDDPLGKHMLKMRPHILLMSRRVHRKVHSDMPRIIEKWDDLKSRFRKIIHDDE